jgi:tetratricopeptide (TPR) repeat protein
MMQGRFAEAQRAATELAERLTPHAAMMPMIESMAVSPAMVLLRFGRSEEMLQLPRPAADRHVMTAWWHFARAVSFARLGRVDESAAAAKALQEAARTVPEEALFGGTGLESARTVLALAGVVADARLQWARGAREQAIARWRDAVRRADALPYDEPPVWFYPLRESLGAALLMSGRAAEAEQVFREDLQRHPRNPRSLFGLHASLVAQQKTADATWVRRAFDTAWVNGDGPLTIESL